MEGKPWRELVDHSLLAEGLEAVFDALEGAGWLARQRYGQYGVAFWPNNERKKQCVLDMRYPSNDPKTRAVIEHTGIQVLELAEEEEGGTG